MKTIHRINYLNNLKKRTSNPDKIKSIDEAIARIDNAPGPVHSGMSREQIVAEMEKGMI